MWQVERHISQDARLQRLTLTSQDEPLSHQAVCGLWQADAAFCAFFAKVLAETPYLAFFWEMPPLTRITTGAAFECILADAPNLAHMAPEPEVFARQFASAGPESQVASFPNLGGDAQLVAPCPLDAVAAYTHIAVFSRLAPAEQQRAFWKEVGRSLEARLGDTALWLSTSGLGVAWLHARLDRTPKYYTHQPYRRRP